MKRCISSGGTLSSVFFKRVHSETHQSHQLHNQAYRTAAPFTLWKHILNGGRGEEVITTGVKRDECTITWLKTNMHARAHTQVHIHRACMRWRKLGAVLNSRVALLFLGIVSEVTTMCRWWRSLRWKWLDCIKVTFITKKFSAYQTSAVPESIFANMNLPSNIFKFARLQRSIYSSVCML